MLRGVGHCDVGSHVSFGKVVVGNGCDAVVRDVGKRTDPKLHRTENARQSPHVLVFQITTVTPSVHLNCQTVGPFPEIGCHVKLGGRHGVLTIAHLPPVQPHIHGGVNPSEMQDKVLSEHLFAHVEGCYIRTHRISVLVCGPVFRRFRGDARPVSHKRVVDIDVDRSAKALGLPVAGHIDIVPSAHVVVLLEEIRRSFLWITAPVETPTSVERHDFFAVLLFRWQLQSGVIRQFVDAEHMWVLPIR